MGSAVSVRVLVTGAAGMLGQKLVAALVRAGALGERAISHLVLVDVVEPAVPAALFTVEARRGDLAEPGITSSLVACRPDVVFHLAAVVSGEAEADVDKGYRINLDGTRLLLDALCAKQNGEYVPRVVVASSIAVFGAPFPDVIGDDEQLTPLTSYGTQKAIAELLLADYSRRGFVDGIALRLPTICVRREHRTGPPRGSSRASSASRSTAARRCCRCPTTFATGSPRRRAATGFFLHAATLDTGALGHRRALTMPGVSTTVAEQLASLRRFGGADAERLVRRQWDETIARMVAGWPAAFDTRRASTLGFSPSAPSTTSCASTSTTSSTAASRSQRDDRDPVVTGAGSGIGRAAAVALADVGFTVVAIGRRRGPLEETAGQAGRGGDAIVGDVTDPASVDALFVEVADRFGRLDLLFNNAGSAPPVCRLSSPSSSGAPSSTRLSPGRSCAPSTPSAS